AKLTTPEQLRGLAGCSDAFGKHILRKSNRRAPVSLAYKGERLFLHALNPGLVSGRRTFQRSRHHRQPAYGTSALKEQVAQRCLRAGMALLRSELQPAACLLDAGLDAALPLEKHLADLELGLRIPVGRGRTHVIVL